MQDRALDVAGDAAIDADDTTIVVCASCAARGRALGQPQLRGATFTTIVVAGGGNVTVMVRRGHNVLATAQAPTEEDALHDALVKLGVFK